MPLPTPRLAPVTTATLPRNNDMAPSRPNDTVQQRSRPKRLHTARSHHAGPVCCNDWLASATKTRSTVASEDSAEVSRKQPGGITRPVNLAKSDATLAVPSEPRPRPTSRATLRQRASQREPGFGRWSFKADSSRSGRWRCAPRDSGVFRSSPTRQARYRSTQGEPS